MKTNNHNSAAVEDVVVVDDGDDSSSSWRSFVNRSLWQIEMKINKKEK